VFLVLLEAVTAHALELDSLLFNPWGKLGLELLPIAKDDLKVFETNPMEVNDRLRVLDRIQCLLLEILCVRVEPVCEA